jgi:2-polyprenyl-3-methyl-5-hydroxy-6-metoxy-1,4-benzoquinol methylase
LKSFDQIWEQIHGEQEWGKYPQEEVIRFVARNYYDKDRESVKILDAGCGAGAVSWYLAREGFDVSGFDGSETAVYKAKRLLSEEGFQAVLKTGDASDIPFECCKFDGVIDSAMIYANTLDSIRVILRECRRVLKTGGKLFSTGLFSEGTTGFGTGVKLEENTYREITAGPCAHRGTAHFFSRHQIQELWTSAGFKSIQIDSVSRTDLNGTVHIEYYIAEAEK